MIIVIKLSIYHDLRLSCTEVLNGCKKQVQGFSFYSERMIYKLYIQYKKSAFLHEIALR